MNLKTSGEICQLLQITPMTLHRWRKSGHINFKKLSSKKFLYDIDSITDQYKTQENRQNIIYARVSTTSQKEDLKTQINVIKSYMLANGIIPNEIFSEIASGMNENRNQLNKLINQVISGKIEKIYITYKDRLTRFGFDYFVNFFKQFGTEIIVINAPEQESEQNEIIQDLISIIHHFSMKIYSNRRKTLQNCLKELKELKEK